MSMYIYNMTFKFITMIKHVKATYKYPTGVSKKIIVPRPQPPKEFKRKTSNYELKRRLL